MPDPSQRLTPAKRIVQLEAENAELRKKAEEDFQFIKTLLANEDRHGREMHDVSNKLREAQSIIDGLHLHHRNEKNRLEAEISLLRRRLFPEATVHFSDKQLEGLMMPLEKMNMRSIVTGRLERGGFCIGWQICKQKDEGLLIPHHFGPSSIKELHEFLAEYELTTGMGDVIGDLFVTDTATR